MEGAGRSWREFFGLERRKEGCSCVDLKVLEAGTMRCDVVNVLSCKRHEIRQTHEALQKADCEDF